MPSKYTIVLFLLLLCLPGQAFGACRSQLALFDPGAGAAIPTQEAEAGRQWWSDIRVTTLSTPQTVNEKPAYVISGAVYWPKAPAGTYTFTLPVSAVFDDSYSENAYVNEVYTCATHGETCSATRYVDLSAPYAGGVSLDYSSGYPGLQFTSVGIETLCPAPPPHRVSQHTLTAFLRYRVLPSGQPFAEDVPWAVTGSTSTVFPPLVSPLLHSLFHVVGLGI